MTVAGVMRPGFPGLRARRTPRCGCRWDGAAAHLSRLPYDPPALHQPGGTPSFRPVVRPGQRGSSGFSPHASRTSRPRVRRRSGARRRSRSARRVSTPRNADSSAAGSRRRRMRAPGDVRERCHAAAHAGADPARRNGHPPGARRLASPPRAAAADRECSPIPRAAGGALGIVFASWGVARLREAAPAVPASAQNSDPQHFSVLRAGHGFRPSFSYDVPPVRSERRRPAFLPIWIPCWRWRGRRARSRDADAEARCPRWSSGRLESRWCCRAARSCCCGA